MRMGEFHFTFGAAEYFISNVVRYFILHYLTESNPPKYRRRKLMKEKNLQELSLSFSVEVIRLCESIKGHSSLVNQLERSATSIGANIHEANYAHSRADFVAKLQIALKESFETEYWLKLFQKTEIGDADKENKLQSICGSLSRMLIASVNTAKR